MKIAQIAPVWHPISPSGNGNIRPVIHLLTKGLPAINNQDNEVTLFTSGDSETHAELYSVFDNSSCKQIGKVYPDLLHVVNAYNQSDEFDIIHDHSGMIGSVTELKCKTPVLHTLHWSATDNAKRLYISLKNSTTFNAISEYQKKSFGDLNFIDIINNTIDPEAYTFEENKEDYLLFIGQMNQQKGSHFAVEIAKKLNMKIKLVTEITEQYEKRFFAEYVKPNMTNKCEIIGEISHEEKTEIYAKAKCTLFPTQWPESFNLDMIESIASGTPVVAIKEGAVPEIILDSKTGYLVSNNIDEICDAVKKIDKINPIKCRIHAIENFSAGIMVLKYEKAYEQILNNYEANSCHDI